MSKLKLFFLSILSGIFLSAAWPTFGFFPLLFIAWIPLLWLEDNISINREKYSARHIFAFSYITFFTWNLLTTWWVYNASLGGAIMAIVFNSLFMAMVFWIYFLVKNKLKAIHPHFIFICFWLSFEYLHLYWDLSWPWLNLGNGFASGYKWVQWYEYTGVFGGSLWILLVNILLVNLVKLWQNYKQFNKSFWIRLSVVMTVIILPLFISYKIYNQYQESDNPRKVVVVQPNIDPYNEKFGVMSPEEQLGKMLNLAAEKTDTSTDFIVFPETALTENIWENEIQQGFSINMIKTFIRRLPKVNIVTGLSSFRAYEKGESPLSTSRKFRDAELYFDAFNTALMINNYDTIQLYHKSKLVPGVEKMPFPALFKPLEDFAIDLGGTAGSLGMQDDRTVFVSADKRSKVAPVICYESIYGEYTNEYIKNGAQILFIITNDGWWGDTPGYKQHLAYGRLRAIETRRDIARSANTGISAFINQRGDISQATEWWVPAVIQAELNLNDKLTFYVRSGDYLAKYALICTTAIFLWLFFLLTRSYSKRKI